jgi:eukaryotic-like serine/threonine-protein kinase
MDFQEVPEKARQIFEQALQTSSTNRSTFLERACSGDPELRDYVIRLMREYEHVSDDLSSPLNIANWNPLSGRTNFTGTSRFKILRQIGAGAFGRVFEAMDTENQTTVALKVLESWRPDSLFRFKHEFRSLTGIRHSHLIQLYELFAEGDTWFFTMELIRGQSFLDWVRPHGNSCRFDRLRVALSQLINGVHALHLSRRVHRDLKPSNVLVSHEARLVILDFGLVREFPGGLSHQSVSLAGTPLYMAPEQIVNRHVTPASDWYSVGVMLFQALTGRLPHENPFAFAVAGGDQNPPASPRQLNPDTPEDLNEICSKLLERQASQRPNGRFLLEVSAAWFDETATAAQETPSTVPDRFVGRTEQLSELESALADTQQGRLNVFLIEGPSGIGKSAMINKLFSLARQKYPNLTALKGRCYQFESVPYKGVDALIDELSECLQHLPDTETSTLLPRDAFLLPRLFPVLGRIKGIANASSRSVVPDEQELRQRTFSALRELIARLSDTRPIVLWIDDLQWADRDSSTLLAELCSPPQQPSVLLLLSYRSEEVVANSTLQYLSRILVSNNRTLGNWHHMALGGLTKDESRKLLIQLFGQSADDAIEQRILAEAQGHPLFLSELVLYVTAHAASLNRDSCRDLTLKEVLTSRISQLPSLSRELLEIVSTSGQPLTQPLMFALTDSHEHDSFTEALSLLVRDNLIRVSGAVRTHRFEPFHDQVRSAVLDSLSPAELRAKHQQLATVLASQPEVEPQVLVAHYRAAGDFAAAYTASVAAAENAEKQLAFDRAAMFYEIAVAMPTIGSDKDLGLHRRFANALGKAGRGRDAARTYVRAAELATGKTAFEMRRLACDQFLRSGFIEEGMSLFRTLAHEVRIDIPNSKTATLARIAFTRFRTRLQLLRSSATIPSVATPREPETTRLEILRTGGVILTLVDPLLATYFQVLYVLHSVRVRAPEHLPMALALESSIRAATGVRDPKQCFSLMEKAQEQALTMGDANVQGLVYTCRVYLDFLLLLVPDGIKNSRQAIDFLRTRCTGVAWELTTCYVLLFYFRCWSGELAEINEQFAQLLKEGAARADVHVQVSLGLLSSFHFAYLAADKPNECLTECSRALGHLGKEFTLLHYGAMFVQVETQLYNGAYDDARRQLLEWWEKLASSFLLLQWKVLRTMAFFLRGRVALSNCFGRRSGDSSYREVEYYAKRLQRIGSHWSHPMAWALQGGIAAAEGRKKDAIRALKQSYDGFEKASLHAFAAAAAYRCGVLRGDVHGQMQVRTAEDFMKSQNVKRPESFVRMLLPGDWLAS